jgi:ferric-chelate reductase
LAFRLFSAVYEYTLDGTFIENLKKPSNAWGWAALVCTDVIVLFSTSFWRKNAYNIFFSTHVISFFILLPAVRHVLSPLTTSVNASAHTQIYRHKSITIPYIIAAAGIYGLDHFIRLFKTRVRNARIMPLPELGMTRIEIPRLNAGWRAGQHVRIRVLSSGMGWYGWAEAHPFTIASKSHGEDGLVLMCKKAGRWTSNLYEVREKWVRCFW